MNREDELNEYLRAVGEARLEDATQFQSLVSEGARVLELGDDDLSELFCISRPTANRWRNGKATPHAGMRKQIFRMLTEQVRLKLRKVRSTRPRDAEPNEGIAAE